MPSVFGRVLPKEETCEEEETRGMIPLVETKFHGSEPKLELGDESRGKQAVEVVPMDMWSWMKTKRQDPTAVVLALTMPPIEVRSSSSSPSVCLYERTYADIRRMRLGWPFARAEQSSRRSRMQLN